MINTRNSHCLCNILKAYHVYRHWCLCHWIFFENTGLSPLQVIRFTFPIGIFYWGISGFETGCPGVVWCRGLTTSLVCWSSFVKAILNELVCKFDQVENIFSLSSYISYIYWYSSIAFIAWSFKFFVLPFLIVFLHISSQSIVDKKHQI